MTSDGYSNKVLIGNWYEDRIFDNFIHNQNKDSNDGASKTHLLSKIMINYGDVR